MANAVPFFFLKEGHMARTIGLITELEVVNSVLSVAGDNPVQSLNDEYQPVFIIKQMINNISRDVQTLKLWFNTEYDVELESNTVTDKITLPFNYLKFEPTDTKYVARGFTVFDREARTSTITESIEATICVMLEFSELPQEVRKYIQAKCRQQYNDEYLGEDSLRSTLAREVEKAETQLMKVHLENQDINVFSSSRSNSIAFRNRLRGS